MFKQFHLFRYLYIFLVMLFFTLSTMPLVSAQSEPRVIEVGDRGISWVKFSPDGQSLVVESGGKLFKYDVATGDLLSQIDGTGFLLAPNGFWGHPNNGTAALIDLWSDTEFTVRELDDPNGFSVSLSSSIVSDDGNLLVLAPFTGAGVTVLVFDISSDVLQEPMTVLEDPEAGSTDQLSAVTISPDNKRVMAENYESNSFIVWNIESGEIVTRFDQQYSDIFYSPDRRFMIAGLYPPNMWDISAGESLFEFGSASDQYYDVQFSVDGQMLAMIVEPDGSNSLDVQLIDANTGNLTMTVASYAESSETNPDNSLGSVDISPDGRYVAAGSSYFGTLLIWDLQASASEAAGCTLTAKRDTVIRMSPSTSDAESGVLAQGESVTANGQAQGDFGMTWYRLDDATWVRAETVDTSPECESLPTVSP